MQLRHSEVKNGKKIRHDSLKIKPAWKQTTTGIDKSGGGNDSFLSLSYFMRVAEAEGSK